MAKSSILKNFLSAFKGQLGFWITLILLLIPLGGLIYLLQERFFSILWYVFSGNLFTEKWGLWMARGYMEKKGIFKMYFLFTALSILYFPWMTVVRLLIDRTKPLVYWTFVISSLAVIIFLLCLLTIGTQWLNLYIAHMGLTQKRILGVVFAFASYCSIFLFLIWAYKPDKKHPEGDIKEVPQDAQAVY